MDKHVPGQGSTKEQEPLQHKSQGAGQGSWRATLKAAWRPIFQFSRANLTAFQALRGTLGVALPLIIGIVVLNQVDGGVIVASGALMLGSIGLTYPYRARTQAMLLTSLFVTLSTLVGGIAGGMGWPTVPLIGVWGLVAGLFASLSQMAQIVGMQSCVAFIVYAHLGLDVPHALLIAGLLGLGAVFQTLLAIIPSPWKNTAPERSALAALYQELAAYAHHPSTSQGALQVSDALFQGYNVLLAGDTQSVRGQIFSRLLSEAERIRLTLSLLNRERVRLQAQEPEPTCTGVRVSLTEIMRASGDELHAISQALRPGKPFATPDPASLAGSYEEVKQAVSELRQFIHTSAKQREMQPLLQHCTALLSELRIARKLALAWRDVRNLWPVALRLPYPHAPGLYLENLWRNLRANLSPRSAAFHHAIRLSVALILAMTLFYVFHLPNGRGYWIPMTAVVVLRSDFITTVTRGTARFLGTLLGAVLTTLLVILLGPSPSLMIVIYLLAVYLMFTTVLANYVIFSIMVTTAVVFLLGFVKAPTLMTAAERALDTTIGGALALLVYLLWPTWERSQLPDFIAQRFEKLSAYFSAVMQAYTDPVGEQKDVREKSHLDSRLARCNALGSLQRARQEPRTKRADLDLADDLLSASDLLARSVITLEAYLLDHPHRDTLPEIADFAQAITQALHQLASATRARRPLTEPLDVLPALQKLHASARARRHTRPETQMQWQLVGEECKRIAKYIRAMQQLLATEHDAYALTVPA